MRDETVRSGFVPPGVVTDNRAPFVGLNWDDLWGVEFELVPPLLMLPLPSGLLVAGTAAVEPLVKNVTIVSPEGLSSSKEDVGVKSAPYIASTLKMDALC